jgi:hypothetical protein
MFLNLSYFTLLFAICIFYLKHTEKFFKICERVNKDADYVSKFSPEVYPNKERIQTTYDKVAPFCAENHNVDYSTHSFMKRTIQTLNDAIYSEDDEEQIKKDFYSLDFSEFKFSLHAVKFLHIFMYVGGLYILIITVPNLVASILLYLVNKILYLIFFFLIAEAIFKTCFDSNSTIISYVTDLTSLIPGTNFILSKAIDVFNLIKSFI